MTRRMARVNDLLREELSELVLRQLKDPRLEGLLTITEVDCSPDLAHARVYISVMGTSEEQEPVMHGLTSASGFLQRELRGRLKLRRVPELRFFLDASIQHGAQLLTFMDSVAKESSHQSESGT